MNRRFRKNPIAVAVATAIGATMISTLPGTASATKSDGTYVSGDFHNHTTCSDGSISMQKLVSKSTDKGDGTFGLDWFVQAGHGGNGNRNCTLAEDASLATPAYPLVYSTDGTTVQGPNTTWQSTNPPIEPKGDVSGSAPSQNMWRWQSIQEYQYPLMEYLNAYLNRPLFMGVESVVAGHEHTSMSVVTGQMPCAIDWARLPTTPGYTPLGNANGLAQWQYCFDRGNSDASRGADNQWDCSVTGSLNGADPSWVDSAKKLVPNNQTGTGVGTEGHNKTVEGLKWMNEFHPNASYYVPAHLERAGPFNPDGNNGFNIESLRDFNNAAPKVAFGFETQPGHGASDNRGEYRPDRNTINGVKVDSVGGTTWGGTGVYGAQIGGVWDALLGEGRNWWFFASSDWHNRGSFGPDDRRSTQDFYPGEYQRDFVMVRDSDRKGHHGKFWHTGRRKLSPQEIVDGLRSGNSYTTSGQLIDRLAFVACPSYGPDRPTPFRDYVQNSVVEALALNAAMANTDVDLGKCATMGEKLTVRPGADIVVAIAVRDPSGTNYSPYSFDNPSLLQVGIHQPLNKPVLDHVDAIRGMVTSLPRKPGDADYAGAWPDNWVENPDMSTVPAAAKNTSAAVIKTFNDRTWATARRAPEYKVMTFRIPAVKASQYVRLRGTNLPASVPWETDADGNPMSDLYTNAGNTANLKIACTAVGTHVPDNGATYAAGSAPIDGCPNHLPVIDGQKKVAFDVAAWADLWFYSNPIYIQVTGSTIVAGVK